jgi:hypothetical protein
MNDNRKCPGTAADRCPFVRPPVERLYVLVLIPLAIVTLLVGGWWLLFRILPVRPIAGGDREHA